MSAPGTRRIDLDADLGEGFGVWRLGDDDALPQLVTSVPRREPGAVRAALESAGVQLAPFGGR